jgi:outer membrane protein insertion porin family
MTRGRNLSALLLGVLFLRWGLAATKEPVLRRIDFLGLKHVTVNDARSWFGLKVDTPLRIADLNQAGASLLSGMASAGRTFCRIDSIVYSITADSSSAELAVYVFEGQGLRQGDILLQNLDSLQSAQIQSRFNSRRGQPLDQERLRQDMDDAVTQMEQRGYPFARFDLQSLQIDSLRKDSQGLKVNFSSVAGPRLVIREIQIIGNKVTRKQVLLREMRVKPGEYYDHLKVGRIRNRLMRLTYLAEVEEPELFWTTGQDGGLLVRVKEGNSSRFDGILGYVPATTDAKGYFTGMIDISLGNLLGSGRALEAHWQKRDQKTQDIKLSYWEPWIAGIPVSAGAAFSQLIQDTTYVQRDLQFNSAMPLLENLSITAQLANQSITPDSLGSYGLGLLRSRTTTAAIGLEYDSRDDRINPRRGVFYGTAVQAGQKKNLGPDELIEQQQVRKNSTNKRILLDVEFYLPLWKRQVLAWTLHGRQIQSNEGIIPLPDQFRLGGARTLRGYREDQFRGSSVSWSALEWRYILGRRSRFFCFMDAGYFSSKDRQTRSEGYKVGYGFGFRLETGLGMMGVDYGLGQGDTALAGKVHVGLVNEF